MKENACMACLRTVWPTARNAPKLAPRNRFCRPCAHVAAKSAGRKLGGLCFARP